MRYECDTCGVAACDLPDEIDPEWIFEREEDDSVTCAGCRGGASVIF